MGGQTLTQTESDESDEMKHYNKGRERVLCSNAVSDQSILLKDYSCQKIIVYFNTIHIMNNFLFTPFCLAVTQQHQLSDTTDKALNMLSSYRK